MPFSDNPLIASLGSAIGLGPVFGDASMAAANDTAKVGASKPNVPMYRGRPYLPPHAPSTGGVRPGGGTGFGVGPDVDPGLLQNPQVQDTLRQYGVDASAVHPNGNMFITNPAAYDRHPVLSGMLEHGLEGLVAYHPGTDPGSTIQNVVGSVLGAQQLRAQKMQSEMQAPFMVAQQVAALRKAQDAHTLANAQVSHLGVTDNVAQQRADDEASYHDGMLQNTSENNQWAHDDRQAHLDPSLAAHRTYFQGVMNDLAAKYGGADKIPADAVMRMITGAETQESMAKGANARAVAGIHASASMQNARERGSRGGSNSQKVSVLKARAKSAESAFNAMDTWKPTNGIFLDPTTNRPIVPGSKAWTERKTKLASDRDTARQALNAEVGLDDDSPVDGTFNPVTGKVEYH